MSLHLVVILFEYEAWSVTPLTKILKDLKSLSGVMTPGDVRRWFAKLWGSSLNSVTHVVTRVEMCYETGSVLLKLHRRGKPQLSCSVTEFRTVLKRVSGTKRKVYGNSGNYVPVLSGFLICVILPVLRVATMEEGMCTICNAMEGYFNRTSLCT
jgi:hypothetical protein